jgi:hypothetical protein
VDCKIIFDNSWNCKLCYFLLRRISLSYVEYGQIISRVSKVPCGCYGDKLELASGSESRLLDSLPDPRKLYKVVRPAILVNHDLFKSRQNSMLSKNSGSDCFPRYPSFCHYLKLKWDEKYPCYCYLNSFL